MALGSWPPKDPAEVLDYTIDWTLRLAGDTIISSTWAALPGGSALTIGTGGQAPAFITNMTKLWLSGGTIGQSYNLKNTITTAAGETMIETAVLYIKAK
jgi:hypothetical protein